METASYSKPTEQEINRAESDLLMAVSAVSGREFARMAGCHESKSAELTGAMSQRFSALPKRAWSLALSAGWCRRRLGQR
ncbi:CII family transcriptional regulator [Serratia marcescens]|uniref:CII family transcriptional regulator n=1 Tax=Serratia marcescens TaxID=615 RepID=UPI00278D4C4E|nr:CII family transcriptional regulator [Serratia marcescens]MDP8748802.1 CII family transcriptional regulator [Serratia marcescens]